LFPLKYPDIARGNVLKTNTEIEMLKDFEGGLEI
jgi:hypothetical protein